MLDLRLETLDLETHMPLGFEAPRRGPFENYVVTLGVPGGPAGSGEAAPDIVSGETRLDDMRLLGDAAPEIADLDGAAEVEAWAERLTAGSPARTAMRAGLSAASWDLAGKQAGEPLWRLLGLRHPRVTTSRTIPPGPTDEMLSQARLAAETHSVLSLRLGFDGDLVVARRLLEALPSTTFRVDGAGRWDRERAAAALELLDELGVELVRQPLPAAGVEDQAWLRERTAVPLLADSALVTLASLGATTALYDGVVVKLQRCGGIAEAFALISACRERGLQVLLGGEVESSLGIAAGLQLAGLADYVDLDGALQLRHDPYEGIRVEGEHLAPSDEPGLGVARRSS
jgi:L-alanine-DL-glutamate epimerase-like enolase superfamily enzyme